MSPVSNARIRRQDLPLIVPPPPPESGLLDSFTLLSSTLRSFKDILESSAWIEEEDSVVGRITRAVSLVEYPIPEEAKGRIVEELTRQQQVLNQEAFKGERSVKEVHENLSATPASPTGKVFAVVVEADFELDAEEWDRNFRAAIIAHLPAEADANAVVDALWRNLAAMRQRGEALRQGLLMAAVAASETFLGQAAERALTRFPALLKESNRTFTSRDVLDATDVAQLQAQIREERVSKLHREGFVGYGKFLDKVLGLDGCITPMRECIERRNVIAHHGGRISQQYVDALKGQSRQSFQLGDEVTVGVAYLSQVFFQIEQTAWDLTAKFGELGGTDHPDS